MCLEIPDVADSFARYVANLCGYRTAFALTVERLSTNKHLSVAITGETRISPSIHPPAISDSGARKLSGCNQVVEPARDRATSSS